MLVACEALAVGAGLLLLPSTAVSIVATSIIATSIISTAIVSTIVSTSIVVAASVALSALEPPARRRSGVYNRCCKAQATPL